MKKTEIVSAQNVGNGFTTTTQSTNVPQREKLEATMINLATCLGITAIHKIHAARDGIFYEPQGFHMIFQSASNTILELSEKLLETY